MKATYTHNHNARADAADLQAARWSERLREIDDDAGTRAAFEAWLGQSQLHARAFRRVWAARLLADVVADAPAIQALRWQTLARWRQRACRRRWAGALAASVLVAVALGLALPRLPGWDSALVLPTFSVAGERYRTVVGQRSVVRLDDGSIITLNTDSRVRVRYLPTRREVTLERGQAMFQVAKDASRPFVVTAGDRRVTALGTRFDVLLSRHALEVTLLEGKVVVSDPEAAGARPSSRTELRPGQQFVATTRATPKVRNADLERVASWVHGQLVFEDERLADAVAQMNRYSRRKIVLGDPRLASLKLSGAFNSGDVDTFVAALTDYFPIERGPGADGIVLHLRTAHAARDPQSWRQ